MWELLIPAFLGLLFKLFFLINSLDSLKKNMFTAMLAISALHSAGELAVVSFFFLENEAELLFRSYYAISVWWLALSLAYTLDLIEAKQFAKTIVLVLASVVSILMFSDIIISGYQSNGYAPTAIKAKYYVIFQCFAISTILCSIILLARSIYKEENLQKQFQSFYVLVAFLSPFLAVTSVIALMQLGVKMNAVAIIPLSTTLFVYLIIKSEKDHDLVDLRRFIPGSPERVFAKNVQKIAKELSMEMITRQELRDRIDDDLIVYIEKKKKSKNLSHQEACRRFGIKSSTLYSLLNKKQD